MKKTPEAHNRYLALAHLVYGITNILLIGVGGLLMLGRGFFDPADRVLTIVFVGVISFLNLAFTAPSFVASWALFKRKPWAKTAAIVAAAVAAMFIPLGLAVASYTFWFLFNAPGKALYDKQPQALPAATTNWGAQSDAEKAKMGMPDWR